MNNKKMLNFLKVLFTILFILWIIAVFILSNQNAKESSNLSGNFIEKILQVKDEIISKKELSNNTIDKASVIEVDNIDLDNKEKFVNPKEKIEEDKINEKRIQKWQSLTRKIAHYVIYAVGGIIIYYMIIAYSENSKITIKKIIFTLMLGVTNAIFDEIHQFFSDGRTMQISDVIIDTLGIGTGISIAIIIIFILNKIINYIYERRKIVND